MTQLPHYVYRPAKNLVLWAYILIALNIVCYVVVVPLNVYSLSLLGNLRRALQGGEDIDEEQYAWAEQTGSFLMVTSLVLFIFSAVLVACWINRAHKNARALGVKGIRHSPAMAVGSFFIPIWAFFVPYQAMKQMVSGSLELVREAAPCGLLRVWWIAYLMGIFCNRISAVMTKKATFESQEIAELIIDIDTLMIAMHLENVAGICMGIAAWVLFILIRRTEHAHERYAKQQGLQAI